MRVLLTGCAGFIGAKIASTLLDAGHRVVGVDNLVDSPHSSLKEWRLNILQQRDEFTFCRADFSDATRLTRMAGLDSQLDRVSTAIHMGALAGARESVANPRSYYEVNVLGTLNLLDICTKFGIGKFVLASTSSVYGMGVDGPVAEDSDSDRPLSPYAASKKAAEVLLHSYHHLHGIDAVSLRYFTVYGPAGRPDMSVFKFIRNVAEGKPVQVYGDGTQQRDFTFVDDIALGTVASLDVGGYEAVNLGYGRPVPLNDVIGLIGREIGKPVEIEYQKRHPVDPLTTWADNRKAQHLLGWSPTVGIEDGIRRTVAWYMANGTQWW